MSLQQESLVAGRYRTKTDPQQPDDGLVEIEAEDTRLGRQVVLVLGEPGVAPDVVHDQATARDADVRVLDGGSVDDRSFLVLQPPDEPTPEPTTETLAAGLTTAPAGIAATSAPVAPPTEVMPSLRGEATAASSPAAMSFSPAARAGRNRSAEVMLALGLVVLIAAVTLVLLWPGGGTATSPVETDPAATATTPVPSTAPTTTPPTTAAPTTTPPTTAASTTQPPPDTRDDDEKSDEKPGGGKRDRDD